MTSHSLSIPLPARNGDSLVIACLAATWVIWGSTYLAIKWALVSLPPFFQMGSRFLVAGFLLLAWMRWWRHSPWPTLLQWRNALVVGALMVGGGMGATAYAEQTVGSGLVVAFVAVIPIMIAALNALAGVLPQRTEAAGIAVGLVGVLLLTQGQGFGASPAGLSALAGGCLAWSVGSVLAQRWLPLAPGAMGYASEMLCGALVLLLVAWIGGELPTVAGNWPFAPKAIWAWLYLVVFGSLIAFNSYMVLLDRASPALASSYSFVNPVIALMLGVAIDGETVSRFEWMATGVILAGVVLLLRVRER